jgi:hypothetical protein
MVRSASPFAIRYSPFASYQHAQPFWTRKIVMTHFDISEKKNHRAFTPADRRAPGLEQKPRGSETAEKPRSPPSELAMNSARTGELVRP